MVVQETALAVEQMVAPAAQEVLRKTELGFQSFLSMSVV